MSFPNIGCYDPYDAREFTKVSMGNHGNCDLPKPIFYRVETKNHWEIPNPYFVIVHLDAPSIDPSLAIDGFNVKRVQKDIDFIKMTYPHLFIDLKEDPSIISPGMHKVSKDRPVSVCGFSIGSIGPATVELQTEALINAGYNAYISRQGTHRIRRFSSLRSLESISS